MIGDVDDGWQTIVHDAIRTIAVAVLLVIRRCCCCLL
jgi:hypothetical protein